MRTILLHKLNRIPYTQKQTCAKSAFEDQGKPGENPDFCDCLCKVYRYTLWPSRQLCAPQMDLSYDNNF